MKHIEIWLFIVLLLIFPLFICFLSTEATSRDDAQPQKRIRVNYYHIFRNYNKCITLAECITHYHKCLDTKLKKLKSELELTTKMIVKYRDVNDREYHRWYTRSNILLYWLKNLDKANKNRALNAKYANRRETEYEIRRIFREIRPNCEIVIVNHLIPNREESETMEKIIKILNWNYQSECSHF